MFCSFYLFSGRAKHLKAAMQREKHYYQNAFQWQMMKIDYCY